MRVILQLLSVAFFIQLTMGFTPQHLVNIHQMKMMATSTDLNAVKSRREAFFLPIAAAAGIVVALPKQGQAFQQ